MRTQATHNTQYYCTYSCARPLRCLVPGLAEKNAKKNVMRMKKGRWPESALMQVVQASRPVPAPALRSSALPPLLPLSSTSAALVPGARREQVPRLRTPQQVPTAAAVHTHVHYEVHT